MTDNKKYQETKRRFFDRYVNPYNKYIALSQTELLQIIIDQQAKMIDLLEIYAANIKKPSGLYEIPADFSEDS